MFNKEKSCYAFLNVGHPNLRRGFKMYSNDDVNFDDLDSYRDILIETIFRYFFELNSSSLSDYVFKNEVQRFSKVCECIISLLTRCGGNSSLLEACRAFLILRSFVDIYYKTNSRYVRNRYLHEWNLRILPSVILRLLAVGLDSVLSGSNGHCRSLVRYSLYAFGIYYTGKSKVGRVKGILSGINYYLQGSRKRSNMFKRISLNEKDTRFRLLQLRALIKKQNYLQEPFFDLKPSDILYSSKVKYFETFLLDKIQHETSSIPVSYRKERRMDVRREASVSPRSALFFDFPKKHLWYEKRIKEMDNLIPDDNLSSDNDLILEKRQYNLLRVIFQPKSYDNTLKEKNNSFTRHDRPSHVTKQSRAVVKILLQNPGPRLTKETKRKLTEIGCKVLGLHAE